MTCREKLAAEHPECIDRDRLGGCYGCPHHYGYFTECPYDCTEITCRQCWDREIPEEKSDIQKTWEDIQTQAGVIKDSGDRTKFEYGAVRDMREGKGRCDLMPLEVVSRILARACPGRVMNIISGIGRFQETGDTQFLYNAIDMFCHISANTDLEIGSATCTMLLEVAKHYEDGAKKYGENNWQKGMPTWCYIDSAVRHYLKWLRGDKDEPHDRAFVWNLMCCIWEVDYREKEETK